MPDADTRSAMLRLVLVLVVLATAGALLGCSKSDQAGSDTSEGRAQESATEEQSTKQPGYDSWVVHINDDDSYIKGGITYSIALNLTATNPTQDIAGTYTGSATAETDTTGDVGGQQLNATAIL